MEYQRRELSEAEQQAIRWAMEEALKPKTENVSLMFTSSKKGEK